MTNNPEELHTKLPEDAPSEQHPSTPTISRPIISVQPINDLVVSYIQGNGHKFLLALTVEECQQFERASKQVRHQALRNRALAQQLTAQQELATMDQGGEPHETVQ